MTATEVGAGAPGSVTTVGERIVIRGEVGGTEDIMIEGEVDGKIVLPEHTLTVGSAGKVKAQVSAKSVIVFGQLRGTVKAAEKVTIGESGSVDAVISAPRVAIAEGADFRGKVDM